MAVSRLQLYTDEECTKEIHFNIGSGLSVAVPNGEAWVVVNIGYQSSVWGFQLTAEGSIEIEVAQVMSSSMTTSLSSLG